jgi:hypothetical protein
MTNPRWAGNLNYVPQIHESKKIKNVNGVDIGAGSESSRDTEMCTINKTKVRTDKIQPNKASNIFNVVCLVSG